MAAFSGWTDYAILQASSGGKQWKVQRHEDGRFRCNCPAFIFCKGTKTCKHCRRCVEQQQKEQSIATPIAQAVAQAKSLQRIEAEKVFDAMCAAATQKAHVNVKATIGVAGGTAMVDVLMARLATWMPPATASPAVAETTVIGVRRITFDD